MGKRSNFERIERDFYPTPYEAVVPLMSHINKQFRFSEPCAGDGSLIKHLECFGMMKYWASDIKPMANGIVEADALLVTNPLSRADCIITNPPWDRKILHPMIEHFRTKTSTWLLFDADWMHTKQSAPYMQFCKKIVSIGRVKWIPDSKMTGKDNCCWYNFVSHKSRTEFVGR